MQNLRNILAAFLSVLLALPHAAAARQPSVADQAALDRAVAAHAARSDADRQTIHRLLDRPQVREIAARAGIDVKRADAAVAALEGAELHQVAAQARAVDDTLAGGQSKITLSTTTIIIGLLVLILIIVAVN
jgi:hypothetical protein